MVMDCLVKSFGNNWDFNVSLIIIILKKLSCLDTPFLFVNLLLFVSIIPNY